MPARRLFIQSKLFAGVKIPKHESAMMEELVTKNLALRAHLLTMLDRNMELEQRAEQLQRDNARLRTASGVRTEQHFSGEGDADSDDFSTDLDERCLQLRLNDLTTSSIRSPMFDGSSPR